MEPRPISSAPVPMMEGMWPAQVEEALHLPRVPVVSAHLGGLGYPPSQDHSQNVSFLKIPQDYRWETQYIPLAGHI